MSTLWDLQSILTSGVQPMLLGIDWMDPNWLLDRFGTALFWISLLIVFVECGLFFPILPGDTLLFAIGLFIATGQLDLFPGPPFVELLIAMAALIVVILAFSVIPVIIEWLRHKRTHSAGAEIGPPSCGPDRDIMGRDVD